MKAKIVEHRFGVHKDFTLNLPQYTNINLVKIGNACPCLVLIVSDNDIIVQRTFRVIKTGQSFDLSGMKYIASFSLTDDGVKYHLFELI